MKTIILHTVGVQVNPELLNLPNPKQLGSSWMTHICQLAAYLMPQGKLFGALKKPGVVTGLKGLKEASADGSNSAPPQVPYLEVHGA